MRRPYIGITGATNSTEPQHLIRMFNQHRLRSASVMLQIGVMMSYETLNGLPTRWARVFPKNEDVLPIMKAAVDRDVLACLHYADYEGIDVEQSLIEALGYAHPYANALQLDMIWPDPDAIGAALARGWDGLAPAVILQVSSASLDAVGYHPERLAERLRAYAGVIDYVLLDESGGEGRAFKASRIAPFAAAIRRKIPWASLAVAGGLGPDTVRPLAGPFIRQHDCMSIDAQSLVCTNQDSRNPLNLMACGQYLREALQCYTS